MIYAIDPSLTGTAVCLWQPGKPEPEFVRRFGSEAIPDLLGRLKRYRKLRDEVLAQVEFSDLTLILIEGYSMGSKGQAITGLAEFGGLLRNQLVRNKGPLVLEVPPTTLKKFVTGTGQCDKGRVQAHAAKRWGVIFDTNDETDAYVLARFGLCYQDIELCETASQREVVTKFKTPKPKKKKRKATND